MTLIDLEQSYGLAWDGSTLVAVDSDLLERARKPLLSASTANNVLSCPAKHLASVALPRTMGPLDAAPLGNAVHSTLELLYQLPAAERTRAATRAFVTVVEPEYASELDGDDLLEWRRRVTAGALGVFKREDPTAIDVVATEMRFDGVEFAPGLPIKGFIDRVDREPDGTLAVRDYKAGAKLKRPSRYGDDYGDQLRAYSRAVEIATGERVSRAQLLFTVADGTVDVDLSQRAMDKTIERYRGARIILDGAHATNRYLATPSALCGWCPLARSCPVAQLTSEKARAAAATQPDLAIPAVGACAPSDGASIPARQEQTMSITIPPVKPGVPRPENKPFEEFLGDGTLNPASYAVGALIAVRAFSARYVAAARAAGDNAWLDEHKGAEVVDGFARTVATVILRAQTRAVGSSSWQSSTNTHIRTFVYNAFDRIPFPFGDAAGIEQYLLGVEHFAYASVEAAVAMHGSVDTAYESAALSAVGA